MGLETKEEKMKLRYARERIKSDGRKKGNIFQLNYNCITELGPLAFNNAEIATVNLRGNRKLQKLDAQAFVGIKSLRYLDLSETSIQSLPTAGLEELENLKIEKTYTMNVFPSIYNFKVKFNILPTRNYDRT
eukprot:XP_003246787.1 PREDICTED: thyrotropin receptor-like [Acyrthosiphon pisum]